MDGGRHADEGLPSSGEFDEASARLVLVEGCARAGLGADGARLLRLGEHAVFRLAEVPVVVRVGRSATYVEDAAREVAVSEWLSCRGVPVVRAVASAGQPLLVGGSVVTFWQAVGDGEDYGTVSELAVVLRRLHALRLPAGLVLPELVPFGRTRRRLRGAWGLAECDRRFLLDRVDELDETYGELTFALPGGPVHGDASVGNLLHDDTGRPVLIDLDGFAVGPREWDLVLTAMFYDSYGWHTGAEYAEFVEGYGFDVMTWEGYPVLRDVRETMMVGWMAQNVAGDDRTAAEFAKRVTALRTGASRRDWLPF